jgi:S-adenosylmethionine:tRNA ribosyltransferase-isomerase
MTQENTLNHIPEDLRLSSYHFELPESLIALRPTSKRDACRLLIYKISSDEIIDTTFDQLPQFLPEKSLLVRNQTKVLPCRLRGQKVTGAKAEVFILGPFGGEKSQNVLIKSSSKKRLKDQYIFSPKLNGEIVEIVGDGTFQMRFNQEGKELEELFDQHAKIPIPPYIRDGESDEQDKLDYQTIYAKVPGSVAAPTAGLHFTEEVLACLSEKNINTANVTLHVGLGTFSPVKTEDLREHAMHTEKFEIDQEDLNKLNQGFKCVAVGTTSLRVLETLYNGKCFERRTEGMDQTNIFLYPGKEVLSIEGLITNFHLPESSLLMLVSALIGRKKTLELYQHAIDQKYRFFSYGDAMLILK